MLRCLIVDDEPLARRLLASFVGRVPFLHLVGTCAGALEAVELMQREPVDVLFLDIQMPDLTGVEFVRTLRPAAQIIFTTAYEHYAVAGFELHATDYLVKPIAFERFVLAAQRAQERLAHQAAPLVPSAAPVVAPPLDGFLFVKVEYQTQRIALRDLRYLEGLKDYVKLHVGAARPVLTNSSLKAFEEHLPAAHFVRVHKSFLVALGWIDSIHRGRIAIGDAVVPVGEAYVESFNRVIAARGAG